MEADDKNCSKEHHMVIVGEGPAGDKQDVVLLEKLSPGGEG